MSELTLDEAIKHCEEVAIENDSQATEYNEHDEWEFVNKCNCEQCAADHRQLAEWLTELKQWRRVYGICPSYEMCIPECKEGYNAQIAECKRLLKAAVEDIHSRDYCNGCIYENAEGKEQYLNCEYHNCFKWRYADEAEKLLND